MDLKTNLQFDSEMWMSLVYMNSGQTGSPELSSTPCGSRCAGLITDFSRPRSGEVSRSRGFLPTDSLSLEKALPQSLVVGTARLMEQFGDLRKSRGNN